MFKDKTIKLSGRVNLVCRDKDGNVKWNTGWLKNTIAFTGLAAVTGLIGDVDSQDPFTYLAVGTSSAAEDAEDTALTAEIVDSGLARAAATVTREDDAETDDMLQLVKVWSPTETKAIEEIGVFNHASAGIMLGRKLTTTKTVNNGDTLTATYQITVS